MKRILKRGLLPLSALLLALSASPLWGQVRTKLAPLSSAGGLRSLSITTDRGTAARPQNFTLSAPTETELREATRETKGARTYTFAVDRMVDVPTASLGEFLRTSDGRYLWRALILAPGAHNVGLRLRDYKLPEGGALFVRSGRAASEEGALTWQNNSPEGWLQVAPVVGDRLEIEYDFPSGTQPEALKLPFTIDRLHYGFRSWLQGGRATNFAETGEPFYDHSTYGLTEASCIPQVIAFPAVWQQARSVVVYITRGNTSSTGVLINNARQDGTPYLLTSGHCLNGLFRYLGDMDYVRATPALSVFFFGFQSPLRDGDVRGAEEMSISGASLVAYNEARDMALLRLEGLPRAANGTRLSIPDSYQPYYAGWSIEPTPQGPFYGIHHPGGTTKRYSETEASRLNLEDYDLGYTDAQGAYQTIRWRSSHWYIPRWAIGTTAPGSSGSPLFDRSGRIIGALTGGASDCDSPTDDYYWSLRQAWDRANASDGAITALSPWLDPDGRRLATLDGYDPLAPNVVQRLSPLYPDPLTPSITELSPDARWNPEEDVIGVANRMSLPSLTGAEVLGSYLVLQSDDQFAARPLRDLRLQLQPVGSDGTSLGASVLSLSLRDLGRFTRLSGNSSTRDESAPRTLNDYRVELFSPAPAGTSLTASAGTYQMSLSTEAGQPFTYPLLMRRDNSSRPGEWTAWIQQSDQSWTQLASAPRSSFWIDLLLKLPQPMVLPVDAPGASAGSLQSYYNAGNLYIAAEPTEVRSLRLEVFDLAGHKMLDRAIPVSGGTEVVTLQQLPAGSYLARLTPTAGNASTGNQPSSAQPLSIRFTHR